MTIKFRLPPGVVGCCRLSVVAVDLYIEIIILYNITRGGGDGGGGGLSNNLYFNIRYVFHRERERERDGKCFLSFSYTHFYIPTTCKCAVWLFIGSVFIWHMYHPWSVSLTSLICNDHVLWSLCVIPILWFFVITCPAIVSMVCVSTLNHATWNKRKSFLHSIIPLHDACLTAIYK